MVVLDTNLIYSTTFSKPHIIVITRNGIKKVYSDGSQELYIEFINSRNPDRFYRKHISNLHYEIEPLMHDDEYPEEDMPDDFD